MTQAVTARRDGDLFQARLFWRKAACLLDSESPIVRVGFESGPKGFDDLWVEYDPNRGPRNQEGDILFREHIQCKWHVAPGSFGYAQLVDPEFINANNRSLLQRALAAQRAHAPTGVGVRFQLATNWRIDRKDPLRELVHTRSHCLRIDKLFGTRTDNSTMGAVRKLWREHLGLDESDLRLLARTLAVAEATDSLDDLRHALDPVLRLAGLRRVPINESAFMYDELIFQWLAQGRVQFDRATFRLACEGEGLLADESAPRAAVFGVKSFEHPTDRLEDRCSAVLNLLSSFYNRQVRAQVDWAQTLYPALMNFLLEAAKTGERVRLVLDAHLTLSFAAGTVLNIKSGRVVEIEQRTIGRRIWSQDDGQPEPSWPSWSFEEETMGAPDAHIGVAVGLTHDVAPAVRAYIREAMPQIGRLLIARPATGSSTTAVKCGRHAFDLAETLTARIKLLRDGVATPPRIHLFVAAPGTFSFFLGQRQAALGGVSLYEFDFEGERSGSYQLSLSFPIPPRATSTLNAVP